MWKKIVLLQLLKLLTISVLAQDSTNFEEELIFKTSEFSISYPISMEIDTNGTDGLELVIYTKLESEQDNFRENINIMVQDLSGSNLELIDISGLIFEELSQDGTIIENKIIQLVKYRYHKLLYSSNQNGISVIFLQHNILSDNKFYSLTFSSEEKEFDDLLPIMKKIMLSFELIGD